MATKKKLQASKKVKPMKALQGRLASNHNEVLLRG